MKKKTKLLILSVIATLAFSGAMSSCGKKGGDGGTSNPPQSSNSQDSGSENLDNIEISINGSATVMEFESIELIGIVTGADEAVTLVWESSDETIATVDQNGVVTGNKAGSVTITATAGDKTASHTLEVTPTNLLHEIAFDISEVKFYAGEVEAVEASVIYKGEALDNEAWGIEYTWEKVFGEDGVVDANVSGATVTFTAQKEGTVTYKVTTTARGYQVENTITITVMSNSYSCGLSNEQLGEVEGGYMTTLTFGSLEELTIGEVYGVKNGEPQADKLTVAWSTESDAISLNGDVITAVSAGEALITGTTEYGGEALTIALTVKIEKGLVTLDKTTPIETAFDTTLEVPAGVEGTVLKVSLGNSVLFDSANSKGSLAGSTVTVAENSLPCIDAELGKDKTMLIEADKMIYSVPVDVYTMIINTAEELDKWQEVAAENAVKAGLCIAEQKGIAYSGYFILGDNIEYNRLWSPYKAFGELWALCYNNANMWVDGVKDGTPLEGAFQEDWGAGNRGGFKGTFDGDGHYIAGIETSGDYSGFIITMGIGGVIKNVAFTDAKIGAGAGLVANRGQGTLENIFVEVASIASGTADKPTHVVIREGNNSARYYSNILVDMSKVDVSTLEYAYVSDMAEAKANGVFVVGVDGMLLTRGVEKWTAGSNDNGSWTASEACVFWHYDADNDLAGAYGNTAALFADDAAANSVNAWADTMWTVSDNLVIPTSLVEKYSADIAITNEDVNISANTSCVLTTNVNKGFVDFALKEAVEGVKVVNGKIVIAEDATVGAKFTVVATSLVDGSKVSEMEFTVAPKVVNLTDTMTVETYNNSVITLPDAVEGTVSKITIGAHVAFNAEKSYGSIDGKAVTVGSMPAAMSDLGDEVMMVVETDVAKYQMTVSVYTMVIDSAEELEKFYDAAADNALNAGLCIEAQKGFAQSGYFVLGADIEYNKVWAHIPYGNRWAMCYANEGIWKSGYVYGQAPTADKMVEGAIVEDWGAGDKGGFLGVFDGKGYAIKGMEIKGEYAGFIGTIGRSGVLKNVAFTGLKIGQKAGLVERGGRGGFVENVYIDLASIESGVNNSNPTKLITQHGNTQMKNIIVNVTNCDFTGIEYAYLLNSAYNVSENIYVIDRDYLEETKMNFDASKKATAFLHFNYSNDTGAKFATVDALLADETHGAVVAGLGGYWKVEEGKLYFGDEEVVMGTEKEFVLDEYKTDVDKMVTLNNAAFTVGSVWSLSINGGEAVEYTVNEEGKATVTVDPATLSSYQAKVVFSNAEKVVSYSNVIAVTYITDLAGLKAIGMGENNVTVTDNLKGYYALANDINITHADDYSDVIAAGYHKAGGTSYQHLWSFQGIFDGNGYKIDNMRVADGGIFGYMENATVKNLKLTNVHLLDNVPAAISKQGGGYASILAFTAPGSTFENIEMTIASSPASAWTWKRDGLFVNNSSGGAATYRNITVDASYIGLKTLLGNNYKEGNVYENVVIKAASYAAIGYTADSYGAGGVQNTAAMLTEFPKGVTFERVVKKETSVVFNDDTALSVYDGDVTALGFAEGANVTYSTITDGWNSRVKVLTNDIFDYVDIQFSFNKAVTLSVWDGVAGNYNVTATGASINPGSGATEREIQVLDADGNTITEWSANTVYTLRVYMRDVNGANPITKLQVSTFTTSADDPTIIYFGNAVHGFNEVAKA